MKKFVGLLVLCVVVQAARGEIVNGSFEEGLNGWSASQLFTEQSVTSAPVLSPLAVDGSPWAPTDGNRFAYLRSGWSFGGIPMYSTLWCRFPVTAGQLISFDFFFDAGDVFPNNDHGFYDLVVSDEWRALAETYQRFSVADVGPYGQTGWRHVSLVVPATGCAQLAFAVIDQGADGPNFSAIGVDNVRLTPEPSALSLLAFGLAALRRR